MTNLEVFNNLNKQLFNGVNVTQGIFRMKNSWGRSWGNHGFAFIGFEDVDRLLRVDGEACIAAEVRADAPPA